MGGLCSKEADINSPSNRPVRTLGSTPQTVAVPAKSKPQKVGGPPRTLGGSSGGGPPQGSAAQNAALAAERRATATASKPKGALGKRLDKQRKMTHTDTLEQASAAEVQQREVDAQAQIQAYN